MRYLKNKCGSCKWFDGTLLDDNGHGRGQCCFSPPQFVIDIPHNISLDELLVLLDRGWEQPSVGVAQQCCSKYVKVKKRWWEE